MAQNSQSANEPKCQFLYGYLPTDREGRFKAPASGTGDAGTFVKINAAGTHWEACGSNDATHILESDYGTGPVANAANREKYLQGFPQNIVGNGAEITANPSNGGRTIRTSTVVTGSATGALTTSTAEGTQVEAYNGELRETQGVTDPIGEVLKAMDSNGYIEIYLY